MFAIDKLLRDATPLPATRRRFVAMSVGGSMGLAVLPERVRAQPQATGKPLREMPFKLA